MSTPVEAALLSAVLPLEPKDGHVIAAVSDVNAVRDLGLRLGLIAFAHDRRPAPAASPYPARVIPVRPGGPPLRFVRGLLTGAVPSIERFYARSAREEIARTLRAWSPATVIIADVALAGYIPTIRDVLPRARVILRTMNVMRDIRTDQFNLATGLNRAAAHVECQRYSRFERDAVVAADDVWAITQADADRIAGLFGRPCGLLSVSLELGAYATLKTHVGKRSTFVHVGSIDLRRKVHLRPFLNHYWSRVQRVDSSATLVLAGRLYGDAISAPNVEYRGPVENDIDVYAEGRIAVNFQQSTGGVKVKTLTAMAAGRTVVSTNEGVEGLPLQRGVHYLHIDVMTRPELKELLSDDTVGQRIAEAGRDYVMAAHSRSAIATQLRGLLG